MEGAPLPTGTGDATTILWGDIAYTNAGLPVTFGVQGGTVDVGNDRSSFLALAR